MSIVKHRDPANFDLWYSALRTAILCAYIHTVCTMDYTFTLVRVVPSVTVVSPVTAVSPLTVVSPVTSVSSVTVVSPVTSVTYTEVSIFGVPNGSSISVPSGCGGPSDQCVPVTNVFQ